MNLFAYIGLNLGVLSLLAITPIQKPVVDTKTYESHLFMQMWGSWENEQETSEEVQNTEWQESGNEFSISETRSAVSEQETQTAETADTTTNAECVVGYIPLYEVEGQMLDPAIQEYLYTQLCNNGIEWFFPYALCIAYQESSFNIYAENKNGLDKGLFQFRITYWGEGDIFNPYTQIDVFTRLMVNRANMGCTVSDMISRHNQSDFGSYCQEYVDAVMSHSGSLTKVR